MNRKIALCVVCAVSAVFLCVCAQAAYAVDLAIDAYHYPKVVFPDELVEFAIGVRNAETTNQAAYLLIALTHSSTGTTSELYTAAAIIPAGGRTTFTRKWRAQAGIYSVMIRVYDANDRIANTQYAKWPLRVGTNKESLEVFPSMLNLGALQPGRHMFPQPIEIRWSFFLKDRFSREMPWYMRIYTDNSGKYVGIKDAIHKISPSGFVSQDGKYTIPMKVWCMNYGPDSQEQGWDPKISGPPSVDEATFWLGPLLDDGKTRFSNKANWLRIPDLSEMTADRSTWRILIGQDPYDAQYATDPNRSGDITLKNPFNIYLATDCGAVAVKRKYTARIIIDIYSP